MTLDQFLRLAKAMGEYELWHPDVLTKTPCIRLKDSAKPGQFPMCPIEAVAGEKNAFQAGPALGLSDYDTHLIVHASDGDEPNEWRWGCKDLCCSGEYAKAFRDRMLEAFGLE